jgi:ribulose-5-phosphate 4-epimerase/fuculose-1-phosphate aldolase
MKASATTSRSRSKLLVVDLDGNLVSGEGVIEDTAYFIHARLHRLRPDLRCIMHTHQPYTLALTMIENGELQPVSQNALRYHGRIAYDWGYTGLALDTDEGDRLADVLGDCDILFLGNHGVLVGGPNVAKCYDDLYFLERAAMAQVLAMGTGQPIVTIPAEIAERTSRQMRADNSHRYATDHFEGLKRVLDREQPDYKD